MLALRGKLTFGLAFNIRENKQCLTIKRLAQYLRAGPRNELAGGLYGDRYQSKSTVLGARSHLPPSLTPLSRETANDGRFGKEGYHHETIWHRKVI